MDPVTLAALITTGGSLLGGLLGSREKKQGVTPSDLFSGGMTQLPGAGGQEQELARLQQELYKSLIGTAGGALPGSLGLSSLASGQLPGETRARLDQTAYGGLAEAGRRISAGGMDRALAGGYGLSSYQGVQDASMMSDLAGQAGQLRASLEMAELNRLSQLRQVALGNMMALQDSPALTRLLQIRMVQPTTSQMQLTRRPGGLPDYAYQTGR